MLVQAFLSILITFINTIFSWLPPVITLPDIGPFDLDGTLVTGVAETYKFAQYVWPIGDVLIGAGILWGYYGIKMVMRLFLGSRAPASHN